VRELSGSKRPAYAAHPERFGNRRPLPPRLPTVAWINQPSQEALIQTLDETCLNLLDIFRFGVSRNTYYEWINKAELYGLSALLPKERCKPHQPNAMSSEEVAVILSEAVIRPTLGPRSLLRPQGAWR